MSLEQSTANNREYQYNDQKYGINMHEQFGYILQLSSLQYGAYEQHTKRKCLYEYDILHVTNQKYTQSPYAEYMMKNNNEYNCVTKNTFTDKYMDNNST